MKTPEDLSKEQLINDLVALRRRINELEKIEEGKKNDEAELAQTRAMFEGLFEFAPHAIVVVSNEGSILQVNRQAERLFGYAREELLGAEHEILLPERFREKHRGHRREFMSDPHVRPMGTAEMELYGRKKDGSEFPVDIALGPLPTENENIVLAVVRDFSEQRKVQKELEHLASFPRLNPDPVVETDFDGNVTYCNLASIAVLKELELEEDCRAFLPNDIKEILGVLKGEEDHSLHTELTIKDRLFSENVHLIPELNVVRFYIQDITKRKHAEAALRRESAQLETANKELDAFTFSVSHDLRAPLRIIKGFSEMALEDHADGINDEVKKLLTTIQRTALRMDGLIMSLLDLSKAGRQEMLDSDIDMGKLVKEAFDEITHGSSERTPRLEIGTLPPAKGDGALIKQVFANLLSNAVKFTRRRESALITVGCRTEEKENVYFVKDNGVGFNPEYSDRLFDAFQRLHDLKEFEGTGVGLSIVQRIVARHGGRVCAEGKSDEGAVFYFSLPRD